MTTLVFIFLVFPNILIYITGIRSGCSFFPALWCPGYSGERDHPHSPGDLSSLLSSNLLFFYYFNSFSPKTSLSIISKTPTYQGATTEQGVNLMNCGFNFAVLYVVNKEHLSPNDGI